MFGAQARAAEYNAARNASARQASRDAAEHNVPAKPLPTPLSAFTRNTAGSRNRGSKAFIPLVFDNIVTESQNTVDGVPVRDLLQLNGLTKQQPDSNSVLVDKIRIRMPTSNIPTAPRAMLESALASAYTSAPDTAGAMLRPASMHSDYSSSQGNATLSSENRTRFDDYAGSSSYYLQISNATEPLLLSSTIGSTIPFSIDDKQSPTEKVAPTQNQSYLYCPDMIQNPLSSHNGAFHNSYHHELRDRHYSQYSPTTTQPNLQSESPGIPFKQQQSSPNQIYENRDTRTWTPYISSLINGFDAHPTTPRNLVRYSSMPATNCESSMRLRQTHLSLEHSALRSSSRSMDSNEPYDRSAKLLKFAQAQQALAKTGRTVLHNPKMQDLQPAAFSGTNTSEGVSCANSPRSDMTASEHTSQKRHVLQQSDISELDYPVSSSDQTAFDGSLQAGNGETFREMTTGLEGCELVEMKPVMPDGGQLTRGTKEQDKSRIADGTSNSQSTTTKDARMRKVLNWFRTDPRGLQRVREEVSRIAASSCFESDKLFRRQNTIATDSKTYSGMIRATGHMLANLTEYLIDSANERNDSDYFTSWAPVRTQEKEDCRNAITSEGRQYRFDKVQNGFQGQAVNHGTSSVLVEVETLESSKMRILNH